MSDEVHIDVNGTNMPPISDERLTEIVMQLHPSVSPVELKQIAIELLGLRGLTKKTINSLPQL